MVAANLTSLISTLITGLHILHYNGVLDAYGHMSVRNPNNSSNFFMSRDVAPALVANTSDIVEYLVSDASPLDPHAPHGFIERYIHSELYKRFPRIQSVVHSHSNEVLPFSFSGVPMRSSIHMAGFLGDSVPVFDINQVYNSSDTFDLLIRTTQLGAALASEFASNVSLPNATQTEAAHAVVLMQNHGFTTVADSVELAVMQAVYTQINAGVQSSAIMLKGAYASAGMGGAGHAWGRGGVVGAGGGAGSGELQYLTTDETVEGWQVISGTSDRPWGLWQHEVQSSSLYQNLLDSNQTKAASPVL